MGVSFASLRSFAHFIAFLGFSTGSFLASEPGVPPHISGTIHVERIKARVVQDFESNHDQCKTFFVSGVFPPGVYSRRLLPLRSGLWSRQRGGVRFSGKGSSTLPGVHSRRLLPPRSGILSHTRGGAVFPGGAPDTEGTHQTTSNHIKPH